MRLSSVLVISVARIGDTILLTPCLKAIKAAYPAATLTVLAHPKRLEVLENLEFVDELAPVSKTTAPWKGWLPGKPHDVALVYGRDAALVRYALRVAKSAICFAEPEFAAIEDRALTKVQPPAAAIHAVDHRLLLLAPIGITKLDDARLAMRFTDTERQFTADFALAKRVAGRHPLIGLQAFSFPAKAHRDWPLKNFAAFIGEVRTVHPSALFVVLGDQLAADRAEALLARYPDCVKVIAGQLGLRHSAALMAVLDLYVGVDTGPTHIAGALGIPMVALYHWRYPAANLRPLQNERCLAIEHPATGNPNGGFPDGMEAIAVEPVVQAALSLLANARGGSGAQDG